MSDLAQPPQLKRLTFSFTGTAMEYFGIWIVNLLLSILTLGIYTAWAKVRRLRYFYGNTWLDGHNFEYHARPMQILIGRIIVVAVLVAINLLSAIHPAAAIIVLLVYLAGLPWLINKAFSFNARMTSYRNVRFGFDGSFWRALWVFILLPMFIPFLFALLLGLWIGVSGFDPDLAETSDFIPLIVLVVLFLIGFLAIIPYISKKTNEYIANGMSFGTSEFSAELPIGQLFSNLGFVIVSVILPLVVAAVVGGALLLADGSGAASIGVWQLGLIVSYVLILLSFLLYAAGVRNIAFNSTSIAGGHHLASNVGRFRYAWIIVSNLIVSVFTIGLMVPWAAVRTWRYLVGQSGIETPGLDQFIAEEEAKGSVTAAEYLDIDGIDFGL